MRRIHQLYLIGILTVTCVIALGAGLWVQATNRRTHAGVPDLTAQALQAHAAGHFVGDVLNPPVPIQDFALPSSTDGVAAMSDLDGTWRLVFFGYLRCPDLCPLTLVDFMRVKELLGDEAANLTFVYISVDGARDTAANMRAYLNAFDPAFVGFSGDDATLQQIQPDYGFYYARRLGSGPQAVYTVDHSTRSYLIDRNGVLRASFAYQTPPPALAEALRWYFSHETPAVAIGANAELR